MKTVFFTTVSDDWFGPVGAAKFIASAKHTHPDIPLVVFGSKEIHAEFSADRSINWENSIPVFGQRLCNQYELVVHFDADSVILSRLDELLAADFDIAGTLDAVHWDKQYPQYLNCGIVAATRPQFWSEWRTANIGNDSEFHEQDIWNKIFHSGKYRGKILDDAACYYGLSSGIHGNDKNRGRTAELRGDGIYVGGKRIKVIHHATGHNLPKLDLQNWFTSEIYRHIAPIIGDVK